MHRRLRFLVFPLALAAALTSALFLPAHAQRPAREIPGEYIIVYKPGVPASERATLRGRIRATRLRSFDFIRAEHLRVPPGRSTAQIVQQFRNDPQVAYIEPNYEWTIGAVPNDPRFPELYGLRNTGQTGGTAGADIKATSAWDVFTGNPNLKIGVIDTGVDYNHPDLAANVWTNPGEIPGNTIDDDNNGYVDDVHGYDFVNNDGDPFDDNGHGTHCAGTIAGVGNNNVGVTGVNWQAKVVGIKFLSASGSGSTAGAISGVQYAIAVGCRLTSNSWGGGGFSQALLDAINAAGAANQLFVAAAGNSSQNTDTSPHYPSSYNTPYVIAVAATDHNDNLASFSNFGATTVDLAAPGVNILSCQPGGGYQLLSGTSMATPHVAGVVGLAMGRFPSATNTFIKQLILNGVDVKPQLNGKVLTNGRLNALLAIADPDETPPGQVTNLNVTETGSSHLRIAWTATGDDGNTGRASQYEVRRSTSPITDEASFLAGTLVPSPDPQTAGSAESMELGGLAFTTQYYVALRARDEFGNPGPISNVANGTTLGAPDLMASPTSFSADLLSGANADQTLTLTNTGPGTLDFTIPTPELAFTASPPYEYLPVAKGQDDGRPGLLGSGGPDGFGYRWVDSNSPNGPTFGWVDISAIGTQIPLTVDDGYSASQPIGMSFPFYGNAYSSFRVHSNGFLSFTETTGAYDGNQPLPNSGAPANLVSPFWDDLDFRTTHAPNARAYYHFDGVRLIVSWVNVPAYRANVSDPIGGPYTFQAILYPTGEVVYQYLSIGTPSNSATVGIQNATKTIGLTTAFNTAYAANNLAVRIAPLRQWLTVTPTSGRIGAGASQNLTVNLSALGLDGGNYAGTIKVLSNDPDESPTNLAATLHVQGAPDIALAPATVDFGTFFVGANPARNLTVSNPGTDQLVVTNVTTTNPAVTPDVTSFTLAPKAARNVVLTYAPGAPQVLNGTVTVASNDPDNPNATAALIGQATPAPAFSVDPASFDVSLNTNELTTRTLRVSNSGGSNYVFTAAPEVLGISGTVTVYGDADNVDLPKDAPDVQSGPAPLRAGGPDVFGYTYQDSDEPGGPSFGWVDISAIGTAIPLNGDDQNLGPFNLGFSFPHYGASFSQFRICSNGWITLNPTNTQTTFTNTALPNTGSTVPPSMFAVLWDDLDFRPAQAPNARAYYHYDGNRTIVQFKNVPKRGENGTTATNNFEVIFYPNGEVVYQYETMNMVTKTSLTIGMQNAGKNDGLGVVFNQAYLKNNLAIRFRPPARFLTVTPGGGTVPPGGFLDLTVGFNATGLFGGTYNGQVHIVGNDPVQPTKNVASILHVTGVPDVAVNPASITFGNVFVGFPKLRELRVLNNGTDALVVSGVTSDNPDFGVDQAGFTVPPLGQALLAVSYNPSSPDADNGILTINSNDPDSPSLAVLVSGTGLIAPDIDPQPAAITETLPIPGTASRTVTLHNTGGSPLSFETATLLTPASVPGFEALELGKEDPDPRPGVLGSGGPDNFGYTWRDSDDPGGPTFAWVDISAIGTPVPFTSNDDNNVQNIPLGFAFPFYGNSFTDVNVCTNGWISFTSTSTDLSNDPLPNTSAPENLIAGFWDDLLPGMSPARVFTHNDGSRFIVSYVGVPRLSSGGPYTFQIILYPSGRIVTQYLDMQGTRTNEATIGIQNAARNDGLTVVHNSNYVHNNMAIEFGTVPEYMTVSPTSGTIPAGGSVDLTLAFDTDGLFGGVYDGAVRITSNDPDEGVKTVPTHLTAVGVADIAATPGTLDFGSVYVGLTADRSVTLKNVGSEPLTITALTFDDPAFALVTTPSLPVTLGQNGGISLAVRWTPGGACSPCTANLLAASSDPDENPFAVALTGIGLVPPEIAVAPPALKVALATTLGPSALTATKLLVIENTGGSDLNWTAEALSALPASVTTESAETGKDQPGMPGDPVTLGHGGPDAFGYRWVDSDDPVGPDFDWVDITGVGTPIPFTGDDQNQGPFPLPFPFTYYGVTYNSFRACTNGWITLNATNTQTTFTNVALPNAAAATPPALIAPFWDDLTFSAAGDVYHHYDGTKFIISYVAVPRLGTGGGPYTFQILLYPSGTVDFQYLDMKGTRLNEATIGIQNATKDVGLTVAFNTNYVKNNLRVRFSSQPGWLSLAKLSGTTAAGARDTIPVNSNATGLADGDYDGAVRIASNDLDEPLTTVPVDLHVGVVAATFDMNPNAINQASEGRWVAGGILPPDPVTPQAVVAGSVLLQRSVPVAAGAPVSYDGGSVTYKFDRSALQAVLPVGPSVPVEVIGRFGDDTWFQATDNVKVMRPGIHATNMTVTQPMPELVPGSTMVPLAITDPAGATATHFDLWYSDDNGETWSTVVSNLTSRFFEWMAPAGNIGEAQLMLIAYDSEGVMGWMITNVFEVTGSSTAAGDRPLPDRMALKFAGRHPASEARIEMALPKSGTVDARVYDVRGARVSTLASGAFEAGYHPLRWDGRDATGRRADAGVYFIRIASGGQTQNLRFVLIH